MFHFLLGLDALDRHCFQALIVQDKLQYVPRDGSDLKISWTLDLVRKEGQVLFPFVSVSLKNATYYLREKLQKLHRKLCHPSSENLYELLKRGDPVHLDVDTRKILDDILRACKSCQRYAPAPVSFRISMPGNAGSTLPCPGRR